jgi:sarcosine oxidase, subunit gamma
MVSNLSSINKDLITIPFSERQDSNTYKTKVDSPFKIIDGGIVNIFNLRGSQRSSIFRQTVNKVLGFELPNKTGFFTTLNDQSLLQIAPDEWLIISKSDLILNLIPDLEKKMSKVHSSITDVSDQFQILYLTGSKCRWNLSKGCSLDLHISIFKPKICAQTLLGLAEITLFCTEKNSFAIICRNSFANYVLDWLIDSANETGYEYRKS